MINNAKVELGRRSIIPAHDRDNPAKFIDQSELTRADIAGNEIEAALIYWNALRGDRIAPTQREFKLDELPPKLIPSVSIIEFDEEPVDFHYRFFGGNMVRVAGMELTGKRYYADDIKGYGYISAELLPLMAERRGPLITISRWQSIRGLIFETTSVRLPLTDEDTNIMAGVTVSSWAHII